MQRRDRSMKNSTTTLPSNGAPAGASPVALTLATAPAGAPPIVTTRWVGRDGVRNSITCSAIACESCDHCARPYVVTVLTPVMGEGLLCPPCLERVREELQS